MLIDFMPVFRREQTPAELASQFSNADQADALNSYVDVTLDMMRSVSDEQAVFIPDDPEADDPHAANEADRYAGWSLVHLVMHVTASAEEAACFSSILARGIEIGGRLRSETDWRQITTQAATVARLEECRRLCLGYLATWPDQPDLETLRLMPENSPWGRPNAAISFLVGLMHWHKHLLQFRNVIAQAQAALAVS